MRFSGQSIGGTDDLGLTGTEEATSAGTYLSIPIRYPVKWGRQQLFRVRHRMAKEVQMPIKMELALRDRFMSVAADQIIRDLMRLYIAESETPDALTAETLRKSAKGEDVFPVSSLSGLFKQLGI